MATNDIINHIRHFFQTADEKALAEVRAAASVDLEGDISVEEYLSGFGGEYFYTQETEPMQDEKVRSHKAGSRVASVRYGSSSAPTSTP